MSLNLNDKTDKQLFDLIYSREERIQSAIDIGGFSHDIEVAEDELEQIYFELKQRDWHYHRNEWKNTETGITMDELYAEEDAANEPEHFIPDSFAECGFCHICGESGKALNSDCMCVLCWRDERR